MQSLPQVAPVHLSSRNSPDLSEVYSHTTRSPLPPCTCSRADVFAHVAPSPWNTLPCVPKGWHSCFSCAPQHFIYLSDMISLACLHPSLYNNILGSGNLPFIFVFSLVLSQSRFCSKSLINWSASDLSGGWVEKETMIHVSCFWLSESFY